jgi:hypothetical protein
LSAMIRVMIRHLVLAIFLDFCHVRLPARIGYGLHESRRNFWGWRRTCQDPAEC